MSWLQHRGCGQWSFSWLMSHCYPLKAWGKRRESSLGSSRQIPARKKKRKRPGRPEWSPGDSVRFHTPSQPLREQWCRGPALGSWSVSCAAELEPIPMPPHCSAPAGLAWPTCIQPQPGTATTCRSTRMAMWMARPIRPSTVSRGFIPTGKKGGPSDHPSTHPSARGLGRPWARPEGQSRLLVPYPGPTVCAPAFVFKPWEKILPPS